MRIPPNVAPKILRDSSGLRNPCVTTRHTDFGRRSLASLSSLKLSGHFCFAMQQRFWLMFAAGTKGHPRVIDRHTQVALSSFSPLATIFNASFGNGPCNVSASSVIATSRLESVTSAFDPKATSLRICDGPHSGAGPKSDVSASERCMPPLSRTHLVESTSDLHSQRVHDGAEHARLIGSVRHGGGRQMPRWSARLVLP